MKKLLERKTAEEMLVTHAIKSRNPDWFLCEREVSNGAWQVEAKDVFGRLVVRSGNNPIELIERIEREIASDFPSLEIEI
ncbi:MAG: hypothetical protein WKF92_00640 [Pyrinomonadaceae bacterium]